MSNRNYNPTGSPTYGAAGASRTISQEFSSIGQGVAGLEAEIDLKAPLASPTLTGTPLAPTAVQTTNTNQIATTAFVLGQAGTNNPLMNSVTAVGTSSYYSRQDHVHPSDTAKLDVSAAASTYAPLVSPALTGNPTTPTPTYGDNDTTIANTAFVQAAINGLIDAAPGTLDTLNEIAAALGDDPNFAATMTQELALKAPLASPALTGTPTAPTQTADNNSTRLATTAFVLGQGGTTDPVQDDSTAAVGTSLKYARADHRHPINPAVASSVETCTTKAAEASQSATDASGYATSALNAKNAAESAYDAFDDRYLGAKDADPSVDNDGNALLTGALYFNSVANEMRVYSGSAWGAAYLPASGYAQSGAITTSGLTMATGKILGRSTAATGAVEELTTKTINGTSIIGSGDISIVATDSTIGQSFVSENNSLKGWPGKNVLISSSQTWTVPEGVERVRLYAFGAGGNGAAGVASTRSGAGGGGGGCAYGNLTVTAGDGLVIALGAGGSGTATTVIRSGVTLLDAKAGGNASGITPGAASTGTAKHASITNGGAYNGGAGGDGYPSATASAGSGASSGSPIGTGQGGTAGQLGALGGNGGAGWGGAGALSYSLTHYNGGGGGGVGGSSSGYSSDYSTTTSYLPTASNASAGSGGASSGQYNTVKYPGAGRTPDRAFADILLAPITGTGGYWESYSSTLHNVVYPGLGGGGVSSGPIDDSKLYNGNIGSGGAGAGSTHPAGTSYLGGGAGSGSSSTYKNGGAGGYGGGGGGGGVAATSVGTAGAGGPGCVIIFW